jgi:hypothetical protein
MPGSPVGTTQTIAPKRLEQREAGCCMQCKSPWPGPGAFG